MNIRQTLLVLLVAPSVLEGRLLAEVPPLSKDQLENQAALIVTGTVTAVRVGQAKVHTHGSEEYEYELTVLVETVKKGKAEQGTALIVRGSYIDLKSGVIEPPLVGSSGHRSDNTGHRLNVVRPGWKLALYLAEPSAGVHSIVYPNGFAVVSMPAQAEEASQVPWLWIAGGTAILIGVLVVGVPLRRRLRTRREVVEEKRGRSSFPDQCG